MLFDRYRSRNDTVPTERMSYIHTTSAGVDQPTYVYGSGQGYIGTTESINDQIHKGYASAKRAGDIIMGDLMIQKWSRTMSPASFAYGPFGPTWGTERAWGDLAVWIESRIAPGLINASNDVDRAKSLVLLKAFAKMNEPPILGGEILGDIEKTLVMIRKPLSSAVSLTSKMLKARKLRIGKTAASAAKATADVWLEYRYGWKPLVLDIGTAVKEVEKSHYYRSKRLVARASQQFAYNTTLTEEISGGIPRANAVTSVATRSSTGRASAGVIYNVNSRSSSEQIAASLGLGIDKLPQTIWELIPLSFVVDWFANIGTWIAASTPSLDQTVLGAWTTTVVEDVCDLSLTTHTTLGPDGIYPAITWHGDGGGSRITTTTITRDTKPVLAPTPSVTFNSLSLTHAADATGLLAQKIISGLSSFRR